MTTELDKNVPKKLDTEEKGAADEDIQQGEFVAEFKIQQMVKLP